jgi:hypothetical protein
VGLSSAAWSPVPTATGPGVIDLSADRLGKRSYSIFGIPAADALWAVEEKDNRRTALVN